MLKNKQLLSLHNYSWSFVWVTSHVVTLLLSSIVRIISIMPMFRVLWSQFIMILHLVDQDCVGFMSPQKLSFVITYLLEDEQELSLGMLIHCKHIYNFWCSMLVLHQFLYVLFTLRYTFYAFSGTNLLTRCRSASSCFLLFLCFRKVVQEIFSELDETKKRSS